MPKNLHKLLKRKYEPNKYILISQTKIRAKPVTNFFRHCPVTCKLKFS